MILILILTLILPLTGGRVHRLRQQGGDCEAAALRVTLALDLDLALALALALALTLTLTLTPAMTPAMTLPLTRSSRGEAGELISLDDYVGRMAAEQEQLYS